MKLWNYIVIFTGIAVFMTIAGLPIAGFSNTFDRIGFNVTSSSTGDNVTINNFQSDNAFWNYFFCDSDAQTCSNGIGFLFGLIGLGGLITVGLYVVSKDKKIALLPALVGVFALWIAIFASIINYAAQYTIFGWIAAVIMVPLAVGYVITCVEWFAGEG